MTVNINTECNTITIAEGQQLSCILQQTMSNKRTYTKIYTHNEPRISTLTTNKAKRTHHDEGLQQVEHIVGHEGRPRHLH